MIGMSDNSSRLTKKKRTSTVGSSTYIVVTAVMLACMGHRNVGRIRVVHVKRVERDVRGYLREINQS